MWNLFFFPFTLFYEALLRCTQCSGFCRQYEKLPKAGLNVWYCSHLEEFKPQLFFVMKPGEFDSVCFRQDQKAVCYWPGGTRSAFFKPYLFTTKTSSLFKCFENVAFRTAAVGGTKKTAQSYRNRAAIFYRESKRHCHRDLCNTVLDIQLSDLSETHVKTQMLFCHLYLLFRNHKDENRRFRWWFCLSACTQFALKLIWITLPLDVNLNRPFITTSYDSKTLSF